MATGLCSKCVTVDKSSLQGGDRRERPWGVEVEADFAKWPRAEVKRQFEAKSRFTMGKANILKLRRPDGGRTAAGRWR